MESSIETSLFKVKNGLLYDADLNIKLKTNIKEAIEYLLVQATNEVKAANLEDKKLLEKIRLNAKEAIEFTVNEIGSKLVGPYQQTSKMEE